MPEATVALGEGKRRVGILRFASDGRRQHSQFEYSDEWLASGDRFALAPGLPLREGGHYHSGREDSRSALPGCFQDAAPDSWGRGLMTRALGGGLSEYDYLVLSDDRTRQGALRFLDDEMQPLSTLSPPIPRLVELDYLRRLAHRFEQDPLGAETEARNLAGVAGSLGGARPKANVAGDGHLWIAKFTSIHDTRPVERVEVATLRMAAQCGIRAAHARLEMSDSSSPIALVRRFDRRNQQRIPYMSARTALDWNTVDSGYYTDIADVIRRISSHPQEDLQELWRRLVFTILVSNTDDHLKNHGFVYTGLDRWRLSPAFDINPSPSRHRLLETGIIHGESFESSIKIALNACEFFDLQANDAHGMARYMAEFIGRHWRQALRNEGCTGEQVRAYTDAFDHEQSEIAMG